MNPTMKALKCLERLPGKNAVHELKGVRQHACDSTESYNPHWGLRGEKKNRNHQPCHGVEANHGQIGEKSTIKCKTPIISIFPHADRLKGVIPVRNCINCKMARKPCGGNEQRMRLKQAGDRAPDDCMCA